MSKRGVDTLLTSHGKLIQTGEEIRFVLVKGPNYAPAPDPVNPKAPLEQFPLVAKFPESVVTPNIQKEPWNTARLYQQDVPKAQEDSDEEADTKDKPKKRWRPRKEAPKRQWILQNQVEFLENMMAKRQRKQLPKDQVSTRYEGVPEHNPSQYILLEQQPTDNSNNIQVTLLPTPNATITFSQPKARKTLSMSEAEMAIQDQRGKMTRFMMHDKQRMLQGKLPATNESRKRLFGKLNSKKAPGDPDEEEEEDIMGDVAFRNRKGSGRARKELLNTLGDSGIKVDQDGVLGGNNDSEFGRGQRFGRFNADGQKIDANGGAAAAGQGEEQAAESTKGNDGLAMADDFYQRDVGAEYEELDYDANEQFDDDDVDVGETEVAADSNGFAADDDEDDDLDEENAEGEGEAGPQGLANLAMFRLMLAKARGEITPEQAAEAAEAGKKKEEEADARRRAMLSEKQQQQREDPQDHLSQIMVAAERSREAAKEKTKAQEAAAAAAAAAAARPQPISANDGVQVDENGQRLITLESVRREIWLHHGTISTKRLMKIFDTKKKKDRQAKFREVVKELCTMETDPVEGRMFVLKQHYSNMG